MATHGYAYLPTGRAKGEYIMAEAWSDGSVSDFGLACLQSTLRIEDTCAFTLLLGGSPCLVYSDGTVDFRQGDYWSEGVLDSIYDDTVKFVVTEEVVNEAVDAVVKGSLEALTVSVWGTLPFEKKAEWGLVGNATLQTDVVSFGDLDVFGERYSEQVDTLKYANAFEKFEHRNVYFYDTAINTWWTLVDGLAFGWVPLSVAIYLRSGRDAAFVAWLDEKGLKRDLEEVSKIAATSLLNAPSF